MHPATDAWMQGDRFGTVVGMGKARPYHTRATGKEIMARPLRIKLDKSGRVVRSHPDDVIEVNPRKLRAVRRTRRRNPHEARRLGQLERRYDRLVGRSPNPRRRHPSGGSGGGGFTVEHFPQYRHPFVVCRPDGSRYQAFNTRMQAAAAAALLNQQKPPRRSRNPRSPLFKLLAQRAGGKRLVYLGGVKFAEKGRPVYFKTPAGARTVAKLLRLQFPMLKRYAFAVAGA
jgi:hypothetical protein